jgi:hypothetical protein
MSTSILYRKDKEKQSSVAREPEIKNQEKKRKKKTQTRVAEAPFFFHFIKTKPLKTICLLLVDSSSIFSPRTDP